MLSFDGLKKAGTELYNAATASFNRFAKIEEVTSPLNHDSQPVYALNELVQACNRSPEDAQWIGSALLRKVAAAHHVTKFKALKAIRYIAANSQSGAFKRACGGVNAAPIREAQSYNGTPHPQLGLAFNLRIREAAKEALEEVFKLPQPRPAVSAIAGGLGAAGGGPQAATRASGEGPLAGRIQGFGSAAGPAGSGGASMPGFGSTSGASGGSASTPAGSLMGTFSSLQAQGRMMLGGGAAPAAPAPDPSLAAMPKFADAARQDARAAPLAPEDIASVRLTIGTEADVVAGLCTHTGGVRVDPTAEQLRAFVAKAVQLDADAVALELTHQLFSPAWQTQARALAGMLAIVEAVGRSPLAHPLTASVEAFKNVPEAFQSRLGNEHAAVRQCARRCLVALGLPETPVEAGAAGAGAGARTGAFPDAVPRVGVAMDLPPHAASATSLHADSIASQSQVSLCSPSGRSPSPAMGPGQPSASCASTSEDSMAADGRLPTTPLLAGGPEEDRAGCLLRNDPAAAAATVAAMSSLLRSRDRRGRRDAAVCVQTLAFSGDALAQELVLAGFVELLLNALPVRHGNRVRGDCRLRQSTTVPWLPQVPWLLLANNPINAPQLQFCTRTRALIVTPRGCLPYRAFNLFGAIRAVITDGLAQLVPTCRIDRSMQETVAGALQNLAALKSGAQAILNFEGGLSSLCASIYTNTPLGRLQLVETFHSIMVHFPNSRSLLYSCGCDKAILYALEASAQSAIMQEACIRSFLKMQLDRISLSSDTDVHHRMFV